jgi:hypothetical protein
MQSELSYKYNQIKSVRRVVLEISKEHDEIERGNRGEVSARAEGSFGLGPTW